MRSSVKTVVRALCIFGVIGVTPLLADPRSDALDREAASMYQQVFSPFCPGRSLNDCPSQKAAELKTEMRAKLEAGESSEAILQEVFTRFGDQYRAVPAFTGVGMLVWLVPVSFVVVGLMVALAVSKSRKKIGLVAPVILQPSVSSEDERRIQEELSKLD